VSETPEIHPYLTLIPDRAPRQKSHMSLGQAKKAVLYRLSHDVLTVPARVYRWTHDGWELMWDIKEGTHREEMPWIQGNQ